jgi:Restriction endonuclease AspBHI N-terminal/Restriction endonuclease
LKTSYSFDELPLADFVVDATYESDRRDSRSSYGSEPLSRLVPGVGNAGGFRKRMGLNGELMGVLLTSTESETDWPDELDPYTGTYTYYGDNRKPGRDLHKTKMLGNLELSKMFELAHGDEASRSKCPIVFVFHSGKSGRDMVFKGLVVPGAGYLSNGEDLVAIWRVTNGQRFQNYRAKFTVLDTGAISGEWVREVFANRKIDWADNRVPTALKTWVKKGVYKPLIAERTSSIRSVKDQLPTAGRNKAIVDEILKDCKNDKFRFEPIAAAIWQLSNISPMEYELTRRFRDGGRDAIGFLKLGPITDPVKVSFALEAKCYAYTNRVGVKEISRLISRIKHREFGVLVTTSAVDSQAYKEIRRDGHPIVILSGNDVAETLVKAGIHTANACKAWLATI